MKLNHALIFILVTLQAKIIILTRHGQRSPTSYNEVEKVKWHPYAAGDLTFNGIEFLVKRGWALSKSFDIYDQDGKCDPLKMEIVSSVKQRTILSTYSYLKGFCPKNYQEISLYYTKNYLQQFMTKNQDLEALLSADYSNVFQLSNLTRSFTIKNDYMFHGHKIAQCPIVKHILQYITDSQAHKDKEQYFKSFKQFQEVLEIGKEYSKFEFEKDPQSFELENYSVIELKNFFGEYKCDWAQQFDVPTFTEEQYNFLNQVVMDISFQAVQYVFYGVLNGHESIKKATSSETFRWIKQAIDNEKIQLHWFSAHDTNIVSMLSILLSDEARLKLGYIALPPFGSDLQLNIQDDMVSVTLNGNILRTKFCDQDSCHKNKVLEFLDKYIVSDIANFCSQKFQP